MISRPLAARSALALPGNSNCVQQCALRFAGQFFVPTSETSTKVIKSVNSNIFNNNSKKHNIHHSDLLNLEEYGKKYLLSFEQYADKHKNLLKTNERGSAADKLQKAYELYTKMSYRSYRESFFPPPNPLIF